MKIEHTELDIPIDLSESGVEYAHEKLIEILIAEDVSNPNGRYTLECSPLDNDIARSIALNQKDIGEVYIVTKSPSNKWRVVYESAGNETKYSVGSTPHQ